MSDPMEAFHWDPSVLNNNNNDTFRNASPAPSVVSTVHHYHSSFSSHPYYHAYNFSPSFLPPPPSQFSTGLTAAVHGMLPVAPSSSPGPLNGVSLVCVESIWKKEDLFLLSETVRVRGLSRFSHDLISRNLAAPF